MAAGPDGSGMGGLRPSGLAGSHQAGVRKSGVNYSCMLSAREPDRRHLAALLIASLVISASILALQYFDYEPQLSRAIRASLLLAVLWLILLIYAIGHFGKRSLWLLLGAPPVLWIAYSFFAVYLGCALWHDCL